VTGLFEILNSESLAMDKWNFNSGDISDIMKKILQQPATLRSISKKIFKGSSTGNDDIFLLKLIKRGDYKSLVFSKWLNEEIELENDLLKPFLHGEDIRKYRAPVNKYVLIFPYERISDTISLIPLSKIQNKYPLIFSYLKRCKADLLKRKGKFDETTFYKYSAARSLGDYEHEKIMIPDMLVENRISIDLNGVFYHGPGIHSILLNENYKIYDLFYYLAILNSKIFWFYIVNTSTKLRGDTYRLTPEFIETFRFPRVNLNNLKERELYESICLLAKQIYSINNEIKDIITDKEEKTKSQLIKLESQIETLIFQLYGLNNSEITKLSKYV